MNPSLILNNDKGSVINVALLILILLTLIGMAVSKNSVVDIKIAANEKTYKQNFYQAEGAAIQAAQIIENKTAAILKNRSVYAANGLRFLNQPADLPSYSTDPATRDSAIAAEDNWVTDAGGTANSAAGLQDTSFLAIDQGIAQGGSLDISTSQLHSFDIYGRSCLNNGKATISIGFLKRF